MALPIGSLDHGIFDLHLGIDEKILRSVLVFIFLAVALRLGGKRELAQINVLDLAVLLLASNALQNALIGNDNSVTGGVIGGDHAVRGQLRLRPAHLPPREDQRASWRAAPAFCSATASSIVMPWTGRRSLRRSSRISCSTRA